MSTYHIKVTLPEDIWQFFESLNGPGKFVLVPGAESGTLEIDADDLWDVAEQVQSLRAEVPFDTTFHKPVEAPESGARDDDEDVLAAQFRRAVARLEELRDSKNPGAYAERARLGGKIDGVKLAASYVGPVKPHAVKIPTGVTISTLGPNASWPVEAVEAILRDHGIEVAK